MHACCQRTAVLKTWSYGIGSIFILSVGIILLLTTTILLLIVFATQLGEYIHLFASMLLNLHDANVLSYHYGIILAIIFTYVISIS